METLIKWMEEPITLGEYQKVCLVLIAVVVMTVVVWTYGLALLVGTWAACIYDGIWIISTEWVLSKIRRSR